MKQHTNRKFLEIRQRVKQTLFNSMKTERSQITTETKRSKSITQVAQFTLNKQKMQTSIKTFHDVYKIMKWIGAGAHGMVKMCYKITDSPKINYAVKILSCQNDPELIRTIIQTFNINRTLNDIDRVIKAYDLYIDENEQTAYWVMEYCNYKSLQSYLDKSISDAIIQQIMKQIAKTLTIIHNKGVCHRDLKPDNILIKIYGQIDVKIIDFGVSKKFMVKKKNNRVLHEMWTRTGSPLYQAPETFLGGGYDEKVDVWSVGIILYQLLCGKFPFFCESQLDTIELITDMDQNVDKNYEFNQLNKLQKDLLRRLLNKNPEKRLSAEEFLLHPWINEINTDRTNLKDDLYTSRINEITASLNLDVSKNIDFYDHIHYNQRKMQEFNLLLNDIIIDNSNSRKSSYQIPSAHTSYDASPLNQVDENFQMKIKKK